MSSTPPRPPEIHSPFWPVQITLLAVALLVGHTLFLLNYQRLDLQGQLDDLQPQVDRAEVANDKMYSLQSDLINLSAAGDQNATKILGMYNLTNLGEGGSMPQHAPPPPSLVPSH